MIDDPFDANDVEHGTDTTGVSVPSMPSIRERQPRLEIDGYVIDSKALGKGGYGRVFRGKRSDNKLVDAIKVLEPGIQSQEDVARFEREIQTCHKLSHPNVVTFRSNGVCQRGDYHGCPFFVMEYMEVGSFKSWIKALDTSTLAGMRSAIRILSQVCNALNFLHSNGVIHRDLKPANILLGGLEASINEGCKLNAVNKIIRAASQLPDDARLVHPSRVKLADFGLAAITSQNSDLTRADKWVGTPLYMAPEQFVDSTRITPAADQYAVGIMLYEILCGQRPYESSGEAEPEVVEEKARSKSLPPREALSQSDKRLRTICERCLQPEAQFRYASAEQLRGSLEAWLNNEPPPPWENQGWLRRAVHNKVTLPMRRNPLRFLTVVATIMLLLAGGYSIWSRFAYLWPSTSCYAHVTNMQGVPVGVAELDESASKNRWYHYRFTREGWYGPIRMVEIRGSNGAPFPWRRHYEELASAAERELNQFSRRHEVTWEFQYTEDGTLQKTLARDADGKLVYSKNFKSANEAEYVPSPDRDLNPFIGTKGLHNSRLAASESSLEKQSFADRTRPRSIPQRRAGSDANLVVFDWAPEGFCQGAAFFAESGEPAVDATGVFGWRASLTEDGRIQERTNLNQDRESAMLNNEGWATVRFTYSNGELVLAEYFDTEGKPAKTAEGSKQELKYQDGRLIQTRLFDSKGSPAWNSQGWSSLERKYDARGFMTKESYFASDGSPTVNHRGFHAIEQKHDDDGNVIQEAFLGVNGNLVYSTDGWAMSRAKYLAGQQVETSAFGVNEEPILAPDGVHLETRRFKEGLLEEVRYYGVDGKRQPVSSKAGYSVLRRTYDSFGNQESESYWGEVEQPNVSTQGYHTWRRKYWPNTSLIKRESYYGPSNERVSNRNGEHAVEGSYDNAGRLTTVEYFDSEYEYVLTDKTHAKRVMTYYDNGKLKTERIFGTRGEPVLGNDWEHGFLHEYDAFGNTTIKTILGPDGHVSDGKGGIAKVRRTFDHRGKQLSESFFDKEGNRVLDAEGSHSWTATYDNLGNRTTIEFFDTEGRRTSVKSGYSILQQKYDVRGQQVSRLFFDTRGKPTLNTEGVHGWITEYDDRGNPNLATLVGLDRKPSIGEDGVASVQTKYDLYGRVYATRFFDAAGMSTTTSDGYHGCDTNYDDRGNKIRQQYVGVDGRPSPNRQGFSIVSAIYDKSGRQVSQRYYATDGRPTNEIDGSHGFDAEYDTRGNRTVEQHVGFDNKATNISDGYSRRVMTYTTTNQLESERFFDAKGEPTIHSDGAHGSRFKYNEYGQLISRQYIGINNKPTAISKGYSLEKLSYNQYGLQSSLRLFDIYEKATTHIDGNHGWDAEYDDRGNRTVTNYLGMSDVAPLKGVSKLVIAHDLFGRQISERYFDAEGQPANHDDGYHGLELEYDTYGNRMLERYIGTDEEQCRCKQGYSVAKMTYNRFGHRSSVKFFDLNDDPAKNSMGFHGWNAELDTFGNTKVLQYVDIDGTPATIDVPRIVTTYDRIGRQTSQRYYNKDNKPTKHVEGYYGFDVEYDIRGNRTMEQYVGFDDRPTLCNQGYSLQRMTYDKLGRARSLLFFDVRGNPAVHVNGGHHRKEVEYSIEGSVHEERYYNKQGLLLFANANGRRTSHRYFDANGNPKQDSDGEYGFDIKYDNKGNRITESYVDENGAPTAIKQGYATIQMTNDELGRRTSERYFDIADRPAVHVDGYHGWLREFDEAGNEVVYAQINVQDKLIADKRGVGFVRKVFDNSKRVVAARHFDVDGNPTLLSDGTHGWIREYDTAGNQVMFAKIDLKDRPIPNINGIGFARKTFNSERKVTSIRYFDINGLPMETGDGYHGRDSDFDSHGNVILVRYIGKDGSPVVVGEGYAAVRITYDSKGNKLSTRYFDASDKPLAKNGQEHGVDAEYDSQGNMTLRRCIGLDNRLVLGSLGYAIARMTFNEKGRLISVRNFDTEDSPIQLSTGFFGWNAEYDSHGKEISRIYIDVDGNQLNRIGVRITKILLESNAERSGLALHDILVVYHGQKLDSTDQLQKLISQVSENKAIEAVDVIVKRDGQQLSLKVERGTLGAELSTQYGTERDANNPETKD